MPRIEHIHAREVLDSRGKPTVEVEVRCAGARAARAIVPSGASTGRFEAVELRDGDLSRLDGSGVLGAVENVCREIAPALVGCDAAEQAEVDALLCELDGAANKSRLGANAILGVSLATAYAAAEAQGISAVEHFRRLWQSTRSTAGNDLAGVPDDSHNAERHGGRSLQGAASCDRRDPASRTAALGRSLLLPLPMVNMISGGLHAGRNLDVQDFLVLPVGAASFRQALEWSVTVYRRVGRVLNAAGYEGYLVGDEGGYGPRLERNGAALELLVAAIEAAGLRPGVDVAIGLDIAATQFYEDGRYRLAAEADRVLTGGEFADLLAGWVERYPIISIEDGAAEDDWPTWKTLTKRLGGRVQLIGDDLFVTNSARLREGIGRGAANSILIKPNQIGTLTETLETLRLALDNDYLPVISARSGETEDATIADLAVATGAGQIKIGSVARSERLAKYNQLLRLEDRLQDQAEYLGGAVFAGFETGTS